MQSKKGAHNVSGMLSIMKENGGLPILGGSITAAILVEMQVICIPSVQVMDAVTTFPAFLPSIIA